MPRRTALIVPAPEADALVVDHPSGVKAHVTVLAWFLDPDAIDEEELAALFARFRAFDFVLDRVERFEGGITWLHPEPSTPFVQLTEAVWRRWPECPPYDGAHDAVVPHLTIATTPVDVDAPLPIACHAGEVQLVEEDDGGVFRVRRSFPLAQGVA